MGNKKKKKMFVFNKFSERNAPFCTGSGSHITRFHTTRYFLGTYLYRDIRDLSNRGDCGVPRWSSRN